MRFHRPPSREQVPSVLDGLARLVRLHVQKRDDGTVEGIDDPRLEFASVRVQARNDRRDELGSGRALLGR